MNDRAPHGVPDTTARATSEEHASVNPTDHHPSAIPSLSGTIPILVTPFRPDGSVDLPQLERQLDFLHSAGVRWVGFGFGSEVPRLDPDELAEMMKHAARYAARRLGIVGNAELTSAKAGVAAVRRVARTGAQVAMVRPTLAAGIGPETLFEAFAEVAEQGGLPIVVQDAPQNTGVTLPAATLARLLADVPMVAALKVEPQAPAPKISAIMQALDGRSGTVIGGLGGLDYLHELQRGSAGTMPGPAFPEVFQLAAQQLEAGKRAEAFQTHARVLPLITLGMRDMDSFLYVQKHLLQRRGVLDTPVLRSPHSPLEARLADEVDELLTDLDLLAFFDQCAAQLGSGVTANAL
jgi:dihydrodipicolinate synthase/N-acetylneuraminate lyase